MKISFKICRVETPLGASMAAELGAEYIGLHAIDQKRLTAEREQAFQSILQSLSSKYPHCRAVLVTRTTDPDFLYRLAKTFRPPLLQLHFEAFDPEPYLALRDRVRNEGNPSFDFIKCIALGDRPLHTSIREFDAWESRVNGILIDSSFHGGTGTIVNLEGARELFSRSKIAVKFIAGGLTNSNVIDRVLDSGADVADVQSSVEILNKEKVFPYQKDFSSVSAFAIACMRGIQISSSTTNRAPHPRLLFSPTELFETQARGFLQGLRCAPIEGIQIDGSDGQGSVPPWGKSPSEWATLVKEVLPEAPLWLHLFSNDATYVLKTCRAVADQNPFLRGVFIQPSTSPLVGVSVCRALEEGCGIPAYLSVTVGTCLSHPEVDLITNDFFKWQLTFPAAAEKEPVDPLSISRTSLAIERLRSRGGTVHLDRGITVEILKSLKTLPDGATLGRGMLDQSVSSILELLRRDTGGL